MPVYFNAIKKKNERKWQNSLMIKVEMFEFGDFI